MPIAGRGGGQLNTMQLDFIARRYDTFSEVFTIEYRDDDNVLQEVDLTGATVQAAIKKKKNGPTVLWLDVSVTGNEITLSKPNTEMDLPTGRYWWDLEVKDADGVHITWVEGRFTMIEHVTEFVETYLVKLWNTIKSVLSFKDILVYPFRALMKALLRFEDIPKTKLTVFIDTIISYVSIAMVVSKITTKFLVGLTISAVPKLTLKAVWKVAVGFITQVYYTREARFSVRVIFYEIQ